jgi:hypothetical protein
MPHYQIAGHTIEVSGKGLDHISGFSGFLQINSDKPSLLTLHLGQAALRDERKESMYHFVFEETACDLARENNHFFLRMQRPEHAPSLLMEIYPQNNVFQAITNMDEHTPGYLLRFAVWIAFGVAALHRQTVSIHASTIVYKGKAVLFLGESGTGKSTHTRLWLNYIRDTELLNDDSPFVAVQPNGKVVACGSPWSGKTPCYKNRQALIAAIVRLSQAPHNTIRRLKSIAAIGALLPSCPPAFAYDDELSGCIHDVLSVVLQQVPIYALECLPDAEAVRVVFQTLQKDGLL